MTLTQLLEEHKRDSVLFKPFDDYGRHLKFAKCVPTTPILTWQQASEAKQRLEDELNEALTLLKTRAEALNNPMQFIGKQVVKKSKKPFKGGEVEAVVTGIIAHPDLEGEYAFAYDYPNGINFTCQGYYRISQVLPVYEDFL